jgi:hypothetical protein
MTSARTRSPAAGHTLQAHWPSGSTPDTMTFPELFALPVTVDLATAARALGISMTTAYRLTQRNAFPCAIMRPTYRYRIPTANLLTSPAASHRHRSRQCLSGAHSTRRRTSTITRPDPLHLGPGPALYDVDRETAAGGLLVLDRYISSRIR